MSIELTLTFPTGNVTTSTFLAESGGMCSYPRHRKALPPIPFAFYTGHGHGLGMVDDDTVGPAFGPERDLFLTIGRNSPSPRDLTAVTHTRDLSYRYVPQHSQLTVTGTLPHFMDAVTIPLQPLFDAIADLGRHLGRAQSNRRMACAFDQLVLRIERNSARLFLPGTDPETAYTITVPLLSTQAMPEALLNDWQAVLIRPELDHYAYRNRHLVTWMRLADLDRLLWSEDSQFDEPESDDAEVRPFKTVAIHRAASVCITSSPTKVVRKPLDETITTQVELDDGTVVGSDTTGVWRVSADAAHLLIGLLEAIADERLDGRDPADVIVGLTTHRDGNRYGVVVPEFPNLMVSWSCPKPPRYQRYWLGLMDRIMTDVDPVWLAGPHRGLAKALRWFPTSLHDATVQFVYKLGQSEDGLDRFTVTIVPANPTHGPVRVGQLTATGSLDERYQGRLHPYDLLDVLDLVADGRMVKKPWLPSPDGQGGHWVMDVQIRVTDHAIVVHNETTKTTTLIPR